MTDAWTFRRKISGGGKIKNIAAVVLYKYWPTYELKERYLVLYTIPCYTYAYVKVSKFAHAISVQKIQRLPMVNF